MAERTPSWFADPDDPALARWHDGRRWTDFTMVVADWTSPEPPPPPAGWEADDSPTAGLTPAFGAAASAPSAPEPPTPDPEPEPEPEREPEREPEPEPEPVVPRPPVAGVRITAPVAAPPPAATELTPAFGARPEEPSAVPVPDEAPAPTPAFGGPPDLEAPGVEEDDGAAATEPDADDDEGYDEELESRAPIPIGHGPEAPGPDWGAGVDRRRPQRRPSGWSDDPELDEAQDAGDGGLLDRFASSPPVVRIGLPLTIAVLLAVLAFLLLGGDDDDRTGLIGGGDGTLQEATANEPGMQDALAIAREGGAPSDISDQDLATLVKGVCSAARRSLVPLNLSEGLAASGVDAATLAPAATAIGAGALEFCPDQDSTIPQVVSVLVARTERMLEPGD